MNMNYSNNTPSLKEGGNGSTFRADVPFNIAVLLTFYSPIFITIFIVGLSIINQNFKGLVYLAWLLIFSYGRNWGMELAKSEPMVSKPGNICTMIQYSLYENSTFSMFFIAFSMFYIIAPMAINRDMNYALLAGFLIYFFLDIFIRYYSGCIHNFRKVYLNVAIGTICGLISTMIMYSTNNQKYMFFNEVSSNKDVCSMPSEQTFKCSVYKNGELVGNL
jgi:hypothetical protein